VTASVSGGMCGICGIVQIGGSPRRVASPGVLARMTDAMSHRGPDDRGLHEAPGVAFGARRLSIVDIEGGHQPFANEDGRVWAMQNGELYNHEALRAELERDGHRLRSRCDTEILPHLYESHGDRFPERLRGMFGAAVWDDRRRRAVVARDRLGIKPIYYAVVDDLLVFASELKSLLASGLVEPTLDYEAIHSYLTLGFVPGPRTPLEGVLKLPPGHVLAAGPDGVQLEAFWRYPEPAPDESISTELHAERLRDLLEESVRMRLMADVPLGAMLSGGLDSSLIVALMARQMSEPVKTFSVGFAEAGPSNELADARFVAETFGTDHHELELSLSGEEVDLAELVWHMDEPLADLSSVGFLALSGLAASHVTVALSGQGADELFGGYRKHRAASIAGSWRRLPAPARRLLEAAAARGPAKTRRAAVTLSSGDAVERLLAMSGHFDDASQAALVRGPLAAHGGAARRALRARLGGVSDDPLPATLYLDAQLGLVDDMLHYFDRASMAHSLEVRVPFLDHHVVELAARIPASAKVRRLETKHVLKLASRGLVPDRIIDKPKIGFFNAAVDVWFRNQTRGAISDYLLGPSPRYAELLDRQAVERLVRAQAAGGSGAGGHALLAILMLEIWLSEYLPRATASAHADRPVAVPAAS